MTSLRIMFYLSCLAALSLLAALAISGCSGDAATTDPRYQTTVNAAADVLEYAQPGDDRRTSEKVYDWLRSIAAKPQIPLTLIDVTAYPRGRIDLIWGGDRPMADSLILRFPDNTTRTLPISAIAIDAMQVRSQDSIIYEENFFGEALPEGLIEQLQANPGTKAQLSADGKPLANEVDVVIGKLE